MELHTAIFAETTTDLGFLSTTMSVVALALSLLTLWLNYLRPFRPVFLLHAPTLRFFRYDQEHVVPDGIRKFPVWGPTLELGITVYNAGVRPGRLTDLRIRMKNADLAFDFRAEYVQDTAKFETSKSKSAKPPSDPFAFRKLTEKCPWRGVLVPKDKPIQESLVFFPAIHGLRNIPLGKFTFVVEYFSEVRRSWVLIGEYELEIWDWVKDRLDAGDGFVLAEKLSSPRPAAGIVDRNKVVLDDEIEKALENGE